MKHCWSCRFFNTCTKANGGTFKKACKKHKYSDGLRREVIKKNK